MAESETAADGAGAGWSWLQPVLTVVMVVVGALWLWSVVRWIARGQAGYGLPALLMVVACGVWLATFGRGRTIEPSSWDPERTVVRVSRTRVSRNAAWAAALPVLFLVEALTSRKGDPTVAGAVYASLFGLVVVGGVFGMWRMLEAELTVGDDQVALTLPKVIVPGTRVSRRRRDAVDGYRRRFGSIEFLPWPPPGGAQGAEARRQRIFVPRMALPAGDVERALKMHGIHPV